MVIYETIHRACKEQRSIVDNGLDLSVLSSTFRALPRLTDVGLAFCGAIEGEDWLLSSFTSDMVVAEESYEYHVRVTSEALQCAKNRGVTIQTISLSFFNLPYYHTWEVPHLSTLSKSLRKLLESVKVLRLIDSSSALELLSHCALDLHRLDLCRIVTEYNALEDFLETNKISICSVGFHDVKTRGPGQLEGNLSELSSIMLCKMQTCHCLHHVKQLTACVVLLGKGDGGCYCIMTIYSGQEVEVVGQDPEGHRYPLRFTATLGLREAIAQGIGIEMSMR